MGTIPSMYVEAQKEWWPRHARSPSGQDGSILLQQQVSPHRNRLLRQLDRCTASEHGEYPVQPNARAFDAGQSNLVRVPVFVFTHNGLQRRVSSDEGRCRRDDLKAFRGLSADQPYLPIACLQREVKDLAVQDFRLFVDGKLQEITGFEKKKWPVSVRDNVSDHTETSDTPSGSWSSADLVNFIPPASENFYMLAFAPHIFDGGCHRIRVEVRRPKVDVFSQREYCGNQTSSDLLNGTRIGRRLERQLFHRGIGKIPLSVQAGAIHDETGRPHRVDVVFSFPWNQLSHSWERVRGKFYASIGILGAVYTANGRLVTRFSDLVWPSWWPTVVEGWQEENASYFMFFDQNPYIGFAEVDGELRGSAPAWLPARYETQFDLPPGDYTLRVVLSDGVKVGRSELPLTIADSDSTSLCLNSVFLSTRFRDAHVASIETAAANFAPQYVPLISKGVRFTPAADTSFSPDQKLIAYFEIYQPQIAAAGIQACLRIVDSRSGRLVKDFPAVDAMTYKQSGSTVIPIAREIPIAVLPKGEYRIEVQASDGAGRCTSWQAASFSIKWRQGHRARAVPRVINLSVRKSNCRFLDSARNDKPGLVRTNQEELQVPRLRSEGRIRF